MFKRLPSRNNRSKGVRVKHVLQICLLLGVCFWLIYQVKHSHDKKKEFDTNDSKTSVRKSADSEIPKLGRKDLHRGEDVIKTEKHEEEEEEETSVEEEEKHEVEEQEEQNRHGVEEQEEEEAKNGETEEEGRGGGDDEIDENDQERKDGEGDRDRDEDFIDEEKEREDEGDEKESEDKESQGENESSFEDKDNDGSTRNTHEAREENYKGDDASSAVTHNAHDTQNLSTETENVSSENTNENTETKNLEKQNKTDNSEDVNEHENKSELVVGEGGTADNGTSLNMIGGEQKVDNSSSNTVDGQGSETIQSNEQQEEGNKSILVTTKTSNDSTLVSIEASHNLTEKNNEMSDSSLQNGTQSVSYSDHPENVTIDGTTTGESVEALLLEGTNNTNTASEDNQSGFNSTEMENGCGHSGQSSDSSNKLKPDGDVSEKMFTSDVTTGAEEGYGLSVKGNTDATQNEKSDSGSDSDGTNEGSDSTNGIEDSIQHDPIDSSDTHFTQDEKEVLTDLGTLPEIKTEGDDSEEVAAE